MEVFSPSHGAREDGGTGRGGEGVCDVETVKELACGFRAGTREGIG